MVGNFNSNHFTEEDRENESVPLLCGPVNPVNLEGFFFLFDSLSFEQGMADISIIHFCTSTLLLYVFKVFNPTMCSER